MVITSLDKSIAVEMTKVSRGNMPGKENKILVDTSDISHMEFIYETKEQADLAMSEFYKAIERGDRLFSFPADGCSHKSNKDDDESALGLKSLLGSLC